MKQSTQPLIQPETEVIFDLIRTNKVADAERLADELLSAEPENPLALYLRGLIYKLNHDAGNAITYLNKALRAKPDFRKACHDLAILLQDADQLELSIKMFEHLVKIDQAELAGKKEKPAKPSAAAEKSLWEWNRKGQEAYARGELEQALAMFRKGVEVSEYFPESFINMGVALWALGRNAEAEEVLMQCLQHYPNHASTLNQLGNTFKDRRYVTKAVAAYLMSHRASPTLQQPLVNLGKSYFELQLYSKAVEYYGKLLKIQPDLLEAMAEMTYVQQMLCRWDSLAEMRERIHKSLEKGQQVCEPFIAMIYANPRQQQAVTARWSHKLFPGGKAWSKKTPLPATARGDGKLRIGYLSSDFQRHATVALINEMFTHHDRERFDIYAYSYGVDDGGPERARVKDSVDHFRDLYNIDDQAACDRIQEDGIDILVDLKGFTQNHRLSLMARRPAP